MGYDIGWIAFEDKQKNEILLLIGHVDTGKPDRARTSPVTGAALGSGWYVLSFNDRSYVTQEKLAALSIGSRVVACQVEEHVMASSFYLFCDGQLVCSVVHDPDQGDRYALSIVGDPPESFPKIRQDVLDELDGAFEIPIRQAAEICGYRHDSWKDGAEPTFTRLEPIN
jgi:hypothetical protein